MHLTKDFCDFRDFVVQTARSVNEGTPANEPAVAFAIISFLGTEQKHFISIPPFGLGIDYIRQQIITDTFRLGPVYRTNMISEDARCETCGIEIAELQRLFG